MDIRFLEQAEEPMQSSQISARVFRSTLLLLLILLGACATDPHYSTDPLDSPFSSGDGPRDSFIKNQNAAYEERSKNSGGKIPSAMKDYNLFFDPATGAVP